jgi:dTDP-glucose 4,6-dehydratase
VSITTLPDSDLEEILFTTEEVFESLRGAHVLITGGTGFVGSWLVASFLWANRRLSLGARLSILTRDPTRVPIVEKDDALEIVRGDVRSFAIDSRPDAIIHAATPATGHAEDPANLIETIIGGTNNVLQIAARSGSIPVLFTSSGAVYGVQPSNLERIPETYIGGPDQLQPRFAYHESKRLAELMHIAEARRSGIRPKIARLFAFVGPRLPLDAHFAIGNFIRDAVRGGPIIVSDGRPVRSYMYVADLASWLWTILARGEPEQAYNVGSSIAYTIDDIARTVADVAGLSINCVHSTSPIPERTAHRYVPETTRCQTELGLSESLSLRTAIMRTLEWERAR